VELVSADVLHAFWIPALGGKRDLVPGRVARIALTPSTAGPMRGQCAEYCGGPHGQMGLRAVAMPLQDFDRWRAAQRRPAAARHERFEALCASCHTIRGTPASGALGPDLTHVASRQTIAAGAMPAHAEGFARWIAAAQAIKPGNLMPSFTALAGDELADLARYLASLE
jgi:cytochrome c oxidase subunit II